MKIDLRGFLLSAIRHSGNTAGCRRQKASSAGVILRRLFNLPERDAVLFRNRHGRFPRSSRAPCRRASEQCYARSGMPGTSRDPSQAKGSRRDLLQNYTFLRLILISKRYHAIFHHRTVNTGARQSTSAKSLITLPAVWFFPNYD